jgi:hypothetical protein
MFDLSPSYRAQKIICIKVINFIHLFAMDGTERRDIALSMYSGGPGFEYRLKICCHD